MSRLFTDLAITTLAADVTSIATVLTVAPGDGALFPTPTGGDSFDIRVFNKATVTVELATVTTRSTDTFSVVSRGAYGTTALALQAGDIVELIACADFLGNVAQKADIQGGSANYAITTGGSTAYVITLDPVPTGYGAGMAISAKPNATSSAGPVTLNVNGLGAKNVKKLVGGAVADLEAGDFTISTIAELRYDGAQFILLNPGALNTAAFVATGTADANVPTNALLKDTARVFTKVQTPSSDAITDSGTLNWDMASHQVKQITADGNVTITTSGEVNNTAYRLRFIQDATGSRTLTLPGTWVASEGWPGVYAGANQVTIIDIDYDGTTFRYAGVRFTS